MSHGAAAPHEAARCARTRAYYRDALGVEAEARRARDIDALPRVEWKGKPLRTLRCHGTSGKGPHDCNVPESMLWALIGLVPFYCVYHRDDAMTGSGTPAAMEPALATRRSGAQKKPL
jgi:hypothetical protein